MPNRTYYPAVFISDVHLGTKGSKAKFLLHFLKSIKTDKIYLVGDIFDFWMMRSKKMYWDDYASKVVRRLLKMTEQGTEIIFVPGNHDEGLKLIVPLFLGKITFQHEVIHTCSNGKHFLIQHGDEYDSFLSKIKWLSVIGSHAYDILLELNDWMQFVRRKLGYSKYWSLSAFLKKKTKQAVMFMDDFETNVRNATRKHKCDGIICGHIHDPKIVVHGDFIYANCGDWVESISCIVENTSGELELIHWHDKVDLHIEVQE